MGHVLPNRTQTGRMSAEDRRQQIVAVATELFSKKGFSGTTTKEIADRAGVSEAIIFRHFATKRDLYAAILQFKTRQSSRDIRSRLEIAAARKDDREFFTLLAEEQLEAYAEDESLLRLLLFSALEGHELNDIYFESTSRDLRTYVRSYIGERIRDGAFHNIDPAATARAFFGMVIHHAQVQILHPTLNDVGLSDKEIAACFVDIFLHGISSGKNEVTPS